MRTIYVNLLQSASRPPSAAHETLSDAYAVLSLATVVALLIRHVML